MDIFKALEKLAGTRFEVLLAIVAILLIVVAIIAFLKDFMIIAIVTLCCAVGLLILAAVVYFRTTGISEKKRFEGYSAPSIKDVEKDITLANGYYESKNFQKARDVFNRVIHGIPMEDTGVPSKWEIAMRDALFGKIKNYFKDEQLPKETRVESIRTYLGRLTMLDPNNLLLAEARSYLDILSKDLNTQRNLDRSY